MQTNYTYTNLYPTINYIPLQDYDLMDEANIRDTINNRLTSINHQENRINRSLLNIAISNPKYLNEFFSRYSGHIFYKKFQYPIALDYSHRDYFNSEAVPSGVNANWIVFSCNEAGRCEEMDYVILIFDSQGRLIAPYNYKIRNLQSGLTIYVRKRDLYNNKILANINAELLSENYTLKVVVLKKKNVTDVLRYVSKTYSDSNIFDFVGGDMNTISPLIDTNYYSLFKKVIGDTYYRQVHRTQVNTILTDNNLLSFNILEYITPNTEFLFYNTIDYSELNIYTNVDNDILTITNYNSKHFNYDLIQSQYDDVGYVSRIPLVTKIGNDYFPLPFKRVYDIYLWINGIKLTPGVDYFINYNNVNDINPPSIVLCENQHFPISTNAHIRIILNQPYHPKNLCAYFDTINSRGIVNFERDIVSYSAFNANLAFSNGRFISSDQIQVINNNILAIDNLITNRRFEYNFNYLVNPDVSNIVNYFNNYESDLDKFIRYSNYDSNIINDYITYNNISNIVDNNTDCDISTNIFYNFVNIVVDKSNTYIIGQVLEVTGSGLDNSTATFNCNRNDNNDLKVIDCNRGNNNCVLVLDCKGIIRVDDINLFCNCASTNFSRYVNIEVDETNGYTLKVTGLRLNNGVAVFDCNRAVNDETLKVIDCSRGNNNCVLVLDCER